MMRFGSALRTLGKHAIGYAADVLGANRLARARHRDSVLVLSYHGAIADEYARHPLRLSNMLTVSELRQQLGELRRLFNPISAGDFRAWADGRLTLAPNPVLVTFDDGYLNNALHVAPLLREAGVPALFFITTGYVGGPRTVWPTEVFLRICFWKRPRIPLPGGGDALLPQEWSARRSFAATLEESCKRMPHEHSIAYLEKLRDAGDPLFELEEVGQEFFAMMNWEQIAELSRQGFHIGAHTVDHPILTRITPARLERELADSKAAVEHHVGRECFCFAYPNGESADVSAEAAAAVRRAGFKFAFTLMGDFCRRTADPVLYDRVWIPGGLSLQAFRTRTSGLHTLAKRSVLGRDAGSGDAAPVITIEREAA